jgi:hypothetical protein
LLDTTSSTRKPPRGVVKTLSPEKLSVHMREIASRRVAYEALGRQVVELVERTRAEQGLPPRVEDPSTLSRIADLVATGGERAT